MNLNPIVLSIPVFFVLIGVELVVERLSHRQLYRLPEAIANLSCGITSQVSGLFLRVLAVGVYELVYENLALFQPKENALYFAGLFLLVDFAYYWAHRMSHEINLFWGGHVVHHQSEDYNLSVALRQSSFQVVWTFAFSLPIAVLGFKTSHFVIMSAINTLYQFWIHTETIGRLGWLEYVFNTPSHHRVHHGRNPKYIDKNHAGTLIIWDKFFGTFQREEERPTYGITKPVRSWNAVWANVDHYAFMASELRRIPSWSDRLKYLFKKPGWMPPQLGGYRPATDVNAVTYQKYQCVYNKRLGGYVLFQYVLCIVCTALLLFFESNFSPGQELTGAAMICLWVVNSGVLFENRSWVYYSEWIRIAGCSSIAALLILSLGLSPMLYGIVALYFSTSAVWFFYATLPAPR